MSYNYQFGGVDNNCTPPGDGVLDYSRGVNPLLNENALNETRGICGGPPGWDWNEDGDALDNPVTADINKLWTNTGSGTGDGLYQILYDYDDWANLYYAGIHDADGVGVPPVASRELVVCQVPPDSLGGGN